jgi:hypothetical protein
VCRRERGIGEDVVLHVLETFGDGRRVGRDLVDDGTKLG